MASKSIALRRLWLPSVCLLLMVGSGLAIFTSQLWNLNGWPQFLEFWQASLHPDLTATLMETAWQGLLTTLAYAICGTVFSICLGFVGSILISDVGGQVLDIAPSLRRGLRSLLVVPRAIHEMLWGLLLINLWGLDPLTAIAAITIPFSAIVAKVFGDILDDTPRPSFEAILQSGGRPFNAFLYGLLPSASKNLLSYSFYRFECSLRSAATLGIIGVGGLGHEIFLSLQSLQYQQVWTFVYALVILNGVIDWSSARCRQRLGCQNRISLHLKYVPKNKQVHYKHLDPERSASNNLFSCILMVVGLVGAVAWSWFYIDPDLYALVAPQTWHNSQQIFVGLWPLQPSLPLLETFDASLQTLGMALIAILGAGCGGMVLSFGTAANFFLPGGLFLPPQASPLRQVIGRLLVGMTRLFLLLCRSVPAPIWALVMLFIVFPGVLPGAIALGIHNLGILGRLMAEVNENLDQQPLVALQAQGASSPSVFLYGVLPMTLPRFLAYSCYRWEVGMRETVIVGLVGAGGLGRLLSEQLSSFDSSGVLWTLGCFILLSLGVDWLSQYLRQHLKSI